LTESAEQFERLRNLTKGSKQLLYELQLQRLVTNCRSKTSREVSGSKVENKKQTKRNKQTNKKRTRKALRDL